jgi:Right handed beta helix region
MHFHTIRFLIAISAGFVSLTAMGQGPLVVPGPPAPSMKTLEQIYNKIPEGDPRTRISTLPATISVPGSYILTQDLVYATPAGDAITITCSGVTLDMMGFQIESGSIVTGNAISIVSGRSNITIKNGAIRGYSQMVIDGAHPAKTWTFTPGGFNKGIVAQECSNIALQSVRVSGCRELGITVQGSGIVMDQVSATENGNGGILANAGVLTRCTATRNGNTGFHCSGTLTACVASDNKDAGIRATPGTVISQCHANGNEIDGIAADYCVISQCGTTGNGRYGINCKGGVISACVASGNNLSLVPGSDGIHAGSVGIDYSTRTGNYPTP